MITHRPTARSLFALALVVSCLGLPTAAGANPASSPRVGVVQLTLAGPDDTWVRVDIRLYDAEAADVVSLNLASCDASGCAPAEHFEGRVDPDAAGIDPDVAAGTARLLLDGRALTVRWEPGAEPATVIGGVEGSGGSRTGQSAGTYVGEPAVATVWLAGVSCEDAGAAVGDGIRVETPEGSTGAGRPLSALRLPPGPLVCG